MYKIFHRNTYLKNHIKRINEIPQNLSPFVYELVWETTSHARFTRLHTPLRLFALYFVSLKRPT